MKRAAAFETQRMQRAVKLWSAAKRFRDETGAAFVLTDQQEYDERLKTAQLAMGQGAFVQAWQERQLAKYEDIVDSALLSNALTKRPSLDACGHLLMALPVVRVIKREEEVVAVRISSSAGESEERSNRVYSAALRLCVGRLEEAEGDHRGGLKGRGYLNSYHTIV